MPKPKAINPFYILLVIVGLVFAITAFAYGVMAFAAMKQAPTAESRLFEFLDEHGVLLMGGELGLLGLFTFAAMGTDEFWRRRAERDSDTSDSSA